MEFGKFGVVLEIEDSVLACLVALAILLVFNCKQMSFIFPNIQVGSILGTLVGSAISATGLVTSRIGQDRDGKCDPLKTITAIHCNAMTTMMTMAMMAMMAMIGNTHLFTGNSQKLVSLGGTVAGNSRFGFK